MKWLLGLAAVLLGAWLLRLGLVAFAMYVLLGAIVLSRFLTLSWMESLNALRYQPATSAEAGDVVPIHVLVSNRGWLPIPWLLLEDLLPSKWLGESWGWVQVKKKRIKIVGLWGGAGTVLDYEIHFKRRGYFQIGPLVLETGDPFGFHRRYRVATEPQFLLVYPKIVPIATYELASRRPVGEFRLLHRQFEDPTRIVGVRAYQTGDPLRRVHWPATARTGQLHSKIYEPSTIAGATILLDFHQSGFDASHEPDRSELAVTTAASLAYALSLLGEPLGFLSNGRDAAERIRQRGWQHDFRSRDAALKSAQGERDNDRLEPISIPTEAGVEQFETIRTALARVELNDGLTLAQLLSDAVGRVPRNATLIAILPAVPWETALTLGHLRRQGWAVEAVLIAMAPDAELVALARLASERIEGRVVHTEGDISSMCDRRLCV